MEEMTNNVVETVETEVVDKVMPEVATPTNGTMAKAIIFGTGFAAAIAAGYVIRFAKKKLAPKFKKGKAQKDNEYATEETEFDVDVISDEDSE